MAFRLDPPPGTDSFSGGEERGLLRTLNQSLRDMAFRVENEAGSGGGGAVRSIPEPVTLYLEKVTRL